MGEIYMRCMRTIIWLGGDIVQPSRQTHRPRRDLEDILEVLVDQDALRNILKRRYFKRVWAIQELVRTPESVIPIHQVDFYARFDTAQHLAQLLGLEKDMGQNYGDTTTTPWLANLHHTLSIANNNLHDVLDFTWNGFWQAIDPREKYVHIETIPSGNVD